MIDLDLEAPGAGHLLLDGSSLPRLGVVDFFVERSLREVPDEVVDSLVARSSFGWQGKVDVVPAYGQECAGAPQHYLGQLARALVDLGPDGAPLPLHAKLSDLLDKLTQRSNYHAILIDVRAGLAELSAGPLLGLGALTLLFGTAQHQTLEGLSLLFANLATLVAPGDRSPWSAFQFVLSKIPPGADLGWFREGLYELFQDHLYEVQESLEGFNFQEMDRESPHYPIPIAFHPGFADWDPARRKDDLTRGFYLQAFGEFLESVGKLVDR